ncbi:MAG TPA: ATP-binding protein, partial [Phototrophicaceae bacterium]|nr:ATP-binding protein [Phototrophicaceae bacterium]
EWELQKSDYQIIASPLTDAHGQITGVVGVGRDITERKCAETRTRRQEPLQIALQKEQELNHIRAQMLLRLGHEFRTPLAVIQTAAEILSRYLDRLSPNQRQDYFLQINQQIRQLVDIMDDVSRTVRADGSPLAFAPSQFDGAALLQIITERFHQRHTGHQLIVTVTGDLHTLWGDAYLIDQIITNLLSNAVKYSDCTATIGLEMRLQDTLLVVRVQDEGIGILPTDAPHIFEPFYRGSNTGNVSGLGMGLSQVRDAVELHQGAIILENQPNGTAFTVHLPQPQLTAAASSAKSPSAISG